MAGRLVGINTAIYSRSGGSHGIGFAIPSNLVKLVVENAVAGRKLERPWLGARLEAVTRDIAEGLGLDRATGALVSRVHAGGPAAQAGLAAGDVVVGVDGTEVADPRSVTYRLTTLSGRVHTVTAHVAEPYALLYLNARSADRTQLYQDRQIFCDYTLVDTGERGCGVLELGKYLRT